MNLLKSEQRKRSFQKKKCKQLLKYAKMTMREMLTKNISEA